MIKVENLTKRYDDTLAIDNLSFEVRKGEVVGLLGPNGAGKTTTMNLLTCYMPPTSGTAEILGYSIIDSSIEVRKRVGYLPEDNPLYEDMDVYEYLDFIASMRGFNGDEKYKRIREVAGICGLNEVISKDIGRLSRGYKQRVGFAQAILHDPEILILDEPTSGLDPNQSREIRELIKELKKEKTIILCTHILSEAQAVSDRVMIINRGRIVADGTREELEKMVQGRELIYVKLEVPEKDAVEQLMSVEGITGVRVRDRENGGVIGYEIETAHGVDARRPIYSFISKKGWVMLEMRREIVSLEEIFRALTEESPVKAQEGALADE